VKRIRIILDVASFTFEGDFEEVLNAIEGQRKKDGMVTVNSSAGRKSFPANRVILIEEEVSKP